MPGSFDYSPPPAPLSDFAAQVLVCRYEPDSDGEEGPYTYLPNVFCESISFVEGAEPPSAEFSYILDDTGAAFYPSQFEELWPIRSTPNPYKVQGGDRLVCLWIDPEGNYRVIWDGFVQLPKTDVAPRSQAVAFAGQHVSVRLWDTVVTGRWQRDGSNPKTPGDPFQTDLPTRFNPDDLPNCTPDDADEEDDGEDGEGGSGAKWPVFLEPKLQPVDDEKVQTYWDLSKLARYLLWYYNDEKFVTNPDFSVLDDLLSCRSPKEGESYYDPDNEETFDEKPIVIRDLDATGHAAMEVLESQLANAGFRMRPVCEGTPMEGGDGDSIIEEPYNYIEIYRFDAAGPTDPKTIAFGPAGASIEDGPNDIASFSAQNSFADVVNQWSIETKPTAYEVGVVLAPGFKPAAGDESSSNRKKWLRTAQDSSTKGDREKYRVWIADECGEGHWDFRGGGKWFPGHPFDFEEVFKDPDNNPDGEYVPRYRPGLTKLFSPDPSGVPYRAQLLVSRDYEGPNPPCLWDGTGTWQVIDGGFRLLKDRLGIVIDIENPMEWDIGKPGPLTFGDGKPPEPSGVLDAVTSIANPGTSQRQKPFNLMLVTVIESDRMIDSTAYSRPASPYPFTVARQIDAKDHFQKQIVDESSPFEDAAVAAGTRLDSGQIAMQDDTKEATTYAEQMRSAHEFPPLAAAITIPRFTTAYSIGDRISEIAGRDVSFQTNAGTEQGEAPAYPFVVAVSWVFNGDGQKTVLQLSDRRSEPAPFRR